MMLDTILNRLRQKWQQALEESARLPPYPLADGDLDGLDDMDNGTQVPAGVSFPKKTVAEPEAEDDYPVGLSPAF